MLIYVNSEERQIPDNANMAALIQLLELGDQRIAVEVNEALVPRSTFDHHTLQAEDKVEIVRAIGGG
ncbi:MAG: sulfur carrier protein ThiS [Candidatus Sedimenticola sp. (ex Thyasira tokunagai)]